MTDPLPLAIIAAIFVAPWLPVFALGAYVFGGRDREPWT